MTTTVFFSWQADTETRGGRNFIERALERAASRIGKDAEVEAAVRELAVDRDTVGVAGSPPIVDTIFRKIGQAAVFVPDLTFVGKRLDGRPTPNPNVLIEYGWALNSLTHSRIVPVMNTAFGEPIADSMPFNMRHLRNPITYCCPDSLDDGARKQVRDELAGKLEAAIRAVLNSDEFRSAQPKPPEPPPFAERQAADGRGRFKPESEPIGIVQDFPNGVRELHLASDPVCWFRMMPSIDPRQTWTIEALKTAMKSPVLLPLGPDWSGLGFFRGDEGYGNYSVIGNDRQIARAVVFAFTRGEIWTIDAYSLQANYREDRKAVPQLERSYRGVLVAYGGFLLSLGLKPPFRWIAGMESLKGRDLYMPTPTGQMRIWPGPDGKCLVDDICMSGVYTPGDPPGPTLKPFFTKLYDNCCARRQDWQDA